MPLGYDRPNIYPCRAGFPTMDERPKGKTSQAMQLEEGCSEFMDHIMRSAVVRVMESKLSTIGIQTRARKNCDRHTNVSTGMKHDDQVAVLICICERYQEIVVIVREHGRYENQNVLEYRFAKGEWYQLPNSKLFHRDMLRWLGQGREEWLNGFLRQYEFLGSLKEDVSQQKQPATPAADKHKVLYSGKWVEKVKPIRRGYRLLPTCLFNRRVNNGLFDAGEKWPRPEEKLSHGRDLPI
ncbi:hypothetical protein V8E53_013526 [Lactarius tabidus]